MAQETGSPVEQLPPEEILLANAMTYAQRIDQETSDLEHSQKEKKLFGEALEYGKKIDQSSENEGPETTTPVEPVDIAPPENLPPEQRKLLGKVAHGVKVGFQHWLNNFNPRGKDYYWGTGVAFGLFEAGVIVLPGGGWVRGAVNLAGAQGAYAVTRLWEKRMATNIEKEFKDKDLTSDSIRELRENRLKEIEHSHKRADVKIKNFIGGVSAGATALSLYGIASTVGPELIHSIKIPEIKVPNIPQASPAPSFPSGPLSPNLTQADAAYVDALNRNADVLKEAAQHLAGEGAEETLKTQAAAAVGSHLDIIDQATREYFTNQHIPLSGVSPETYEGVRLAVQHNAEAMSNQSFFEAASIDPSHAGAKGAEYLTNRLADHHDQLIGVAQQAFEHSQAVNDQFAQAINIDLVDGSTVDPQFVSEVIAQKGTNVGQLLIDNNIDVGNFGAAQAKLFGAHIAANHDSLKQMWIDMATAGELPKNAHFPMSLSELDSIIEKASAGDPLALQKLKEALHWIPAVHKFKILSPKAIMEILAILKKG